MEKFEAFEYWVEGASDLNQFALDILELTNLKRMRYIMDVKTTHDSNVIIILIKDENDSGVKKFGEIIEKRNVKMFEISNEDLRSSIDSEIETAVDKWLDNDDEPQVYITTEFMNAF